MKNRMWVAGMAVAVVLTQAMPVFAATATPTEQEAYTYEVTPTGVNITSYVDVGANNTVLIYDKPSEYFGTPIGQFVNGSKVAMIGKVKDSDWVQVKSYQKIGFVKYSQISNRIPAAGNEIVFSPAFLLPASNKIDKLTAENLVTNSYFFTDGIESNDYVEFQESTNMEIPSFYINAAVKNSIPKNEILLLDNDGNPSCKYTLSDWKEVPEDYKLSLDYEIEDKNGLLNVTFAENKLYGNVGVTLYLTAGNIYTVRYSDDSKETVVADANGAILLKADNQMKNVSIINQNKSKESVSQNGVDESNEVPETESEILSKEIDSNTTSGDSNVLVLLGGCLIIIGAISLAKSTRE